MQTVEHVRQALSTRRLSLYQVSRRSAEIFGRSSPYYIPERLYHDLAGGAVPTIHRLAALSQISRYRLCDWLGIFGFRLDDIPKLQLLIPRRNTVVLDSSVYDVEQWVPWFTDRLPQFPLPRMTPLTQILQPGAPKRARELLLPHKPRFLYAKIGWDDPFAFPALAPGSIVRIDVRPTSAAQSLSLSPSIGNKIFLVQNGPFLHCGRLRRIDSGRMQLYSTQFPFTQLELSPGRDAQILGLVDAEIRIFASPRATEVPTGTLRPPKAGSSTVPDPGIGLQELLRTSRLRVGVSYREVSRLSRWIAGLLADPIYFTAPGTLSDYEKSSSPLHHVQKILLLCVLYCIDFWTFLHAGGLSVDSLGNDPLPDALAPRRGSVPNRDSQANSYPAPRREEVGGFLSPLINRWQELPLFLKDSLTQLFGLRNISLANIFWSRENQDPIHPALVGASLLIVNRRVRVPVERLAPTLWQEPLYVILLRNGAYLCGSCTLRHGVLTVHPHSERPQSSICLRNKVDGELIGQVTGVVRCLSQV